MSVMNLSGGPDGHQVDGAAHDPGPVPRRGSWVTFTAMAYDGLAWSRITSPQQDARAACLLVTAHIHLFRPDVPLRDLDAKAEIAIQELEDGAATVMVIDDRHRVDRTGPLTTEKDPVNTPSAAPDGIDVTSPHPARMYDYYLNGKDHWAADREAAEQVLAVAPEVRAIARANRAFLHRAVRYLAGDKGITQFLDIGTGVPTSPNVHETAAAHVTGTRVVYADNDPVVHAHANALLTGTGTTKIILADLRDPAGILAKAGEFLDFSRPVALLLVAILHFIPDDADPAGIVAALSDALAPGSFLALSHGTTDFHPAEVTGTAMAAYDSAAAPLVLRPRAVIERFLDGFTPEDPGLVQVPLWRPDTRPKPAELKKIGMYAAVAAKS
jgi:hypothetical protein